MSPLNWIIPPRRSRWPYDAPASPPAGRAAGKRKRRTSVLGLALQFILTAVTLAGLAALVYAYSSGYRLVTVHGGSMGESIPVGSVVLGKTRSPEDVSVGDVILIREQRDDGTVAPPKIHRVIEKRLVDGAYTVRTKGDNNPEPDPNEYFLADKTLVSQTHIPRLGYWISFAATPLGWMLIVAVPFTSTALIGTLSIWRGKPKAARTK